jgi:ABC-type polysaccharide/polyol phosphate export permease
MSAPLLEPGLTAVLTAKNLKVRYRSALLGYAWAAASPLIYGAIYLGAFSALGVRRPDAGWAATLVGVAVWQWTAGVVSSSPSLALRNLALLRRVPLRWNDHVIAGVLCEAAPVAAVLPLAALLALWRGETPGPLAVLLLPFLAVAQTAALAGWASAAAAGNALVRDVDRMTGPLLMALFLGTPVMFEPSTLPAAVQRWLVLNPAAVFVEAWRGAFAGSLSGPLLAAAAAHAAVGAGLAVLVQRAGGRRLAEFQ